MSKALSIVTLKKNIKELRQVSEEIRSYSKLEETPFAKDAKSKISKLERREAVLQKEIESMKKIFLEDKSTFFNKNIAVISKNLGIEDVSVPSRVRVDFNEYSKNAVKNLQNIYKSSAVFRKDLSLFMEPSLKNDDRYMHVFRVGSGYWNFHILLVLKKNKLSFNFYFNKNLRVETRRIFLYSGEPGSLSVISNTP